MINDKLVTKNNLNKSNKELYNKFRDNNKVLDTIVEYIQEEVGGYCNIQEIENYINEVIKKIGASKKVVDNKKY